MRERIKISLLSILCVAAAATANAAPTVRTINGTYDSAAAAAAGTTSSRAGSLRTGGYIRPTATVSTSSATRLSRPEQHHLVVLYLRAAARLVVLLQLRVYLLVNTSAPQSR